MTALALLFTLSALGISETVYLIRKRRALQAPVCLIGEDCVKVLTSRYRRLFGVSNDILGFLFYVLISFLAAFLVIGVQPLELWGNLFKIAVALGSLISLFLVYLQWRVIQAWCFWCLMSASTIWLMAFIIRVSSAL
jgi:uncharacterized membrane protein